MVINLRCALFLSFVSNLFVSCNLQDDFPNLVNKTEKAVIQIYTFDEFGEPKLQGAGFYINQQGQALTNIHVIKNAERAIAVEKNGKQIAVEKILKTCTRCDIALIQIATSRPLAYLPINSQIPQKGEQIYTIGHPNKNAWTVSKGEVSNLHKGAVDKIQVTAPTSPGNSGGPILNMGGQALGILSYYNGDGQLLNFAYSLNCLKNLKNNKRYKFFDSSKVKIFYPNLISKYDSRLILKSVYQTDTSTKFNFYYYNTEIRKDKIKIFTPIKNKNNAFYLEDLETKEKIYVKRTIDIPNSIQDAMEIDLGATISFSLEFPKIKKLGKYRLKEGNKIGGWEWDNIDFKRDYSFNFNKEKTDRKYKILGLQYKIYMEEFEEAYEKLEIFSLEYGNDEYACILMGIVAFKNDKINEAIGYFEKALKLNPQNQITKEYIKFLKGIE